MFPCYCLTLQYSISCPKLISCLCLKCVKGVFVLSTCFHSLKQWRCKSAASLLQYQKSKVMVQYSYNSLEEYVDDGHALVLEGFLYGTEVMSTIILKNSIQMHVMWNMERDNKKKVGTCGRSTIAPLAAAVRWSPLLAQGGTADGWRWSGNGTGTGNCGGESVWAREMSGVGVRFASHFIGDTVTAFVTLLPVPCVTG